MLFLIKILLILARMMNFINNLFELIKIKLTKRAFKSLHKILVSLWNNLIIYGSNINLKMNIHEHQAKEILKELSTSIKRCNNFSVNEIGKKLRN